jgi:hypothetical protein
VIKCCGLCGQSGDVVTQVMVNTATAGYAPGPCATSYMYTHKVPSFALPCCYSRLLVLRPPFRDFMWTAAVKSKGGKRAVRVRGVDSSGCKHPGRRAAGIASSR